MDEERRDTRELTVCVGKYFLSRRYAALDIIRLAIDTLIFKEDVERIPLDPAYEEMWNSIARLTSYKKGYPYEWLHALANEKLECLKTLRQAPQEG